MVLLFKKQNSQKLPWVIFPMSTAQLWLIAVFASGFGGSGDHLVQPSPPKQSQLEHIAQDSLQLCLNTSVDGDFPASLSNLFQLPRCPHNREVFCMFDWNFLYFCSCIFYLGLLLNISKNSFHLNSHPLQWGIYAKSLNMTKSFSWHLVLSILSLLSQHPQNKYCYILLTVFETLAP